MDYCQVFADQELRNDFLNVRERNESMVEDSWVGRRGWLARSRADAYRSVLEHVAPTLRKSSDAAVVDLEPTRVTAIYFEKMNVAVARAYCLAETVNECARIKPDRR